MRYKLNAASAQEVGLFMKIHDLRFTDVDNEEKNRLANELAAATGNANISRHNFIF
jgi:hypothetical protein